MKTLTRFIVLLHVALALIVATSAAFALDPPHGSAADSRIKYINYNSDDVILVNTCVGCSTQINLQAGEKIKFVSSGFNAGWQLITRGDALIVMPQSVKLCGENANSNATACIMEPEPGKWDTDVNVQTDRRSYTFQLVLRPGNKDGKLGYDPEVAFRIVLKYPDDETAKHAHDLEVAQAKALMNQKPAIVDRNYTMQIGKNSSSIVPTEAYNDGRFTYLRFPNNRDLPAAFLVDQEGHEERPNWQIDPTDRAVLIVQRVAPQINLRLGNQVVAVFDESFSADGVPATDGTTVPGMKRVLREQEQGQTP